MSFRGRYPTRFRRSGGFKKSFASENEFTFKRKFHEDRGGSSFKRPRGASSFHRKESNFVNYQPEYDRGRGQWNSRRPRGRNLRSHRSRYMRGRNSHYEPKGRQPRQHFERSGSPGWFGEEEDFDSDRQPRQHFERPRSPEWFGEEEVFDSDRPLFNQRSPRIDYDEEEELGGFDESFNRRSRSPLIIKRTFGKDSPERYSRERSLERRIGSPEPNEPFEQERNLHERRSRSRSYRSRSVEKYDHKMRDRTSAERSGPFFRCNSREGSFDRRHSPNNMNFRHSLDRRSHYERVERNNYSRSPERLYDRRNTSPLNTSRNRYQRHHFSESEEVYVRRNDLPLNLSPRNHRSGSEASYHSSLHNFQGRDIPYQGNNSFKNYGSPNRQNSSPGIRRRSEERINYSHSRLEGHVTPDFEKRGSPSETHYRQPVNEKTFPKREFSGERDELYSKRSFSHDNIDDQNFRRNGTDYFLERQRMKRVFNRERRRGHEKRSESSIERFLNDCKKSVERRPESSRTSSPRDNNREYEFEMQQFRPHSSRRQFHGPDQIVIERGRSFERSVSPNNDHSYQNSKNVLGSPTEWGNGKKEIVSQIKEPSANIAVSLKEQTEKEDSEQKKDIDELEKTENPVSSLPSLHSNVPSFEGEKEISRTDGGSNLRTTDLDVSKKCTDLNLSPISQHESFETKEPSPNKETQNNCNLSPISQSSLSFKDSFKNSAQPNDANIEFSPISQRENFDKNEIVDSLDLSPISQPGSFEKREFLHETDLVSGLSPISQNSLIGEKETTNEKKTSKSSESCDSMQEFLKELERSCERSGSESSFEYRVAMFSNKNKETFLSSETNESHLQKKPRDSEKSQHSWKSQPMPQNTKCNQGECQNSSKYDSKITYTYQGHKEHHENLNYNNAVRTSSNEIKSSTESHWKGQDISRKNMSKNTIGQTGEVSSQNLVTIGSYNPLKTSDNNQNQCMTYDLHPYNQMTSVKESVVLESNPQDLQHKPKENPSQNQHVLQILGPKHGSKFGQSANSVPLNFSYNSPNPENQTPQFFGTQSFNQPFNQFTTVNNMPNQFSNFSMPENQNVLYSQNIPIATNQNVYGQNDFVNIPNQNIQTRNMTTPNAPFTSGMSMINFNPMSNLNQPYSLEGTGLPSSLFYSSESNFNNIAMFNGQNSQFSSGTQNSNLNPVIQSTQFSGSHPTINQTIPGSQNLTSSFSQRTTQSYLGTSKPSYKNVESLKSKSENAPIDIKKCLSGTFGPNYLSLVNNAAVEVISISDDEIAEGSNCYGSQSQDFISLNPMLLDQYKNNPPSVEEMAKMLEGFVIFFDVKTNSDLEKDPFVVIHESFAKSNKFGNLQAEETNLYVDFLPVPKKVCVLRWQGLMLARAEGYTLEEARRKASITLINALAQNCYTVQTKYSYYCGGKLPKFMMKTKEQPGVYKVVERDEIIKAVTDVLKEMKQKGIYTGRGVDATSITVVLDFIDSFFRDKSSFCELLFGGKLVMDYSHQDLKQISNHVKRLSWLQWRTIGGFGRGTYTAVSRVKTPQQLCRYLLANGGETARYKLLPPQGPWIELLTADAQYHPAILKSISKKAETPQDLNKRSNRTPGGFGTGWGKRGTWK